MIEVHPASTRSETTLSIRPRVIMSYLLVVMVILLIANLIGVYYQQTSPRVEAGALVIQYFNFNTEGNIPTFYSAILMLIAAVLLFVVALQNRRTDQAKYWWVLGCIFLFMAMDESAQIHEGVTKLMYLMLSTVQLPGYFLYAWVIPYSLAILAAGLFFFNFMLKLPSLIRNLFFAAGGLFVTGALGLEMLEGHYNIVYGYGNVYTTILCTIEELLEMSGVILFIYALLICMTRSTRKITLQVTR